MNQIGDENNAKTLDRTEIGGEKTNMQSRITVRRDSISQTSGGECGSLVYTDVITLPISKLHADIDSMPFRLKFA